MMLVPKQVIAELHRSADLAKLCDCGDASACINAATNYDMVPVAAVLSTCL